MSEELATPGMDSGEEKEDITMDHEERVNQLIKGYNGHSAAKRHKGRRTDEGDWNERLQGINAGILEAKEVKGACNMADILAADLYGKADRGGVTYGDTEHGDDELGLTPIANALADTLIFRDLTPPFVLGILGKWGRGKSFFFNLMLKRMIETQRLKSTAKVQEAFAGHIYIVRFDAWTFSKGDIWSSIMYQILKDLNEQLQLEEVIGRDDLMLGKISTIEVLRDLSTREVEYFEKTYRQINRDQASKRLLEAINANYEKDQEKLEEIREKMSRIRKNSELERQAEATVDTIKWALNFWGRKNIERAYQRWLDHHQEGQSEDDPVEEMKKVTAIVESVWWFHKVNLTTIPRWGFVCATSLAIFLFFVLQHYIDQLSATVSLVTSCLLSVTAPIISSISAATKKIGPVVDDARKQYERALKKIDVDLEANDVDNVDETALNELNKLKSEGKEIEERSLILEGSSLRDVANKIDRKVYESNLGVVHRVQKDLQLLSDGMLNKKQKDKIFPRGDPRIVLLVDDLDRCDHVGVVQVIEALQLLVKTKLFVAVLAIDPRYVTLSLEKQYKNILNPRRPPSGMDFLEKIIQIPFRLPGVGKDYLGRYISSQIETEIRGESASPQEEKFVDNVDEFHEASPQDLKKPGIPNKTINVSTSTLPNNKLSFTTYEKDMMIEVLRVFHVSPRCLRRVINVYKVLQLIWKEQNQSFERNKVLRRATLFLMLLASDESTRDVTYKIFDLMEDGAVKYDGICDTGGTTNEGGGTPQTLASLFKEEFKKEGFSLASRNVEGTLMHCVGKYLGMYTWNNVKSWNNISSKFMLARSFSFFRLVADENVDELMNQGTSGLWDASE